MSTTKTGRQKKEGWIFKMKIQTVKKICDCWNAITENEAISTERVFEIIRYRFGLEDVSDVVDALKKGGVLTKE